MRHSLEYDYVGELFGGQLPYPEYAMHLFAEAILETDPLQNVMYSAEVRGASASEIVTDAIPCAQEIRIVCSMIDDPL